MAIRIDDWTRYEVNSNGDPAKEGDTLRAGALRYIRLKNHGHATNRGLNKLQKLAKNKTMEVVGIFTQFLQLAGNGTAEYRGVLREQKNGEPATIEDLAEILPATASQIAFAVKCLSNPTVSWILVDKEGFRENPRNSGITSFNTTQYNSTQHNTTQDNSTQPTTVVFEKWNSYKSTKGWKSHNKPSYEIEEAINEQLKHYSIEDLCAAIDNYAFILGSPDHCIFNIGKKCWDKFWTLREFLLRSTSTDRKEKYLYRFLPSVFAPTDFLTQAAKGRLQRKRAAERDKEEIREREGPYYRKQTTEELKKLLTASALTSQHWLIKEILAEKAKANR